MSIDFPKEEEAIIQKWRDINAFHRQVKIQKLNINIFAPHNGVLTREPNSSS